MNTTSRLILHTEGVLGKGIREHGNQGLVKVYTEDGEITFDAFEGMGADYKRREETQITIKDNGGIGDVLFKGTFAELAKELSHRRKYGMTLKEIRRRDSAIGYADHTGTIDEGTRIMDVEDMGEPEPERRPTFAEIVRDEVESHYNNGDSNDETAQAIAKVISRAVADIYGKGNAARYILDTISYHVQGHCNPALSDEE